VVIAMEKPKGVGGPSLTIDSSQLEMVPGLRSSQLTLTLELRSSRGTQHRLRLPEGSLVESLVRDGANQPLRQEGNQLVLDVLPGKHAFKLSFRLGLGLSPWLRAPELDLGLPSTNGKVVINLAMVPRWILWLGGPRLGPSVHLWSALVVLALLGWGLARTRLTPLRSPTGSSSGWDFSSSQGGEALEVGSSVRKGRPSAECGFRRERCPSRRPLAA
jgi:hypothetical protein